MNLISRSLISFIVLSFHLTPLSFASETAQAIFTKYSPHVVYVENKLGGMGTGFLIRPNSIITNRHVVFGYDPVLNKWNAPKKLLFRDGSFVEKYDHIFCSTRVDICFITFKEKKTFLHQPSFTTRPVKAGEDLIVIGHPSGILAPIISEGIASSELSQIPWNDIYNKNTYYLGFTTNASISKGSSGSPVISKDGDILGIAVGILNDSQNINFVISSSEVLGTLDKLLKNNGKETFALDYGFEIELDNKIKEIANKPEGRAQQNPKPMISLDVEEYSTLVRSILVKNLPSFKFCYEQILVNDGNYSRGIIILEFAIGASGSVINAKAKPDSPLPAKVSSCVVSALKEIQFPKPSGGRTIEIKQPFNFYPREI